MTRQECETKLLEKWKELWELYKQYNPNGNYITAYVLNSDNEVSFGICNEYYEADIEYPIQINGREGKTNE